MCMLVSCTNYYELLWGQAMLWMHWSQIYKIPTAYCRVGILHLLIPAHGSMSPVTVRIVSLECKLLSLLGAWNKCCFWNLLIWMLAPQYFPFYLLSDLGNANLSGTLVPQLGQLRSLQYLWVFINLWLHWSFLFLIFHLDYVMSLSFSSQSAVAIQGIYRSSLLVLFLTEEDYIFI